ncbi:hypothetical protein MMC27_001152 [Xylographa pallens]|nr:hypothetical protein [Xylographa pallens]
MDKRKLIAVMGPTGSGKSSFVRAITGCESVRIGRGLHSETTKVSMYDTTINSTCFTLIDTPGFDDTEISDHDVLGIIADWLHERYEAGQLLTGIFYLQPITKNRAEEHTPHQYVLESGKRRGRGPPREGDVGDDGFLEVKKEQGAKTERMARDYDRFKTALSAMAGKSCISLQIQEELHDGKTLQETMAALSIDAEARKMREEHERKLEESRIQAQEELSKRDKLLEKARKQEAARQQVIEKEAERKAENARKAEKARISQLEQLQERNRRIKQAQLDRQAKAEETKQAERQRWQEEQALQAKAERLAADTKDGYRLSWLQRESVDRDIDYIRTAAQAGILQNEINGIAPSGQGMSDGNGGFSVDRSGLNHWCDICQNPIGARRKISMIVPKDSEDEADVSFSACSLCHLSQWERVLQHLRVLLFHERLRLSRLKPHAERRQFAQGLQYMQKSTSAITSA